jgi:phosphoglycolate phosphatase-like HAD superfamily hydrolase
MRAHADLTLVLFDIDGTLLDTHGAGRQSFVQALAAVFGWRDDIGYIQFAGATDLDVLARIAARRGHTLTPAEERAFLNHLPRELARTLPGARLELYPGCGSCCRRSRPTRGCGWAWSPATSRPVLA